MTATTLLIKSSIQQDTSTSNQLAEELVQRLQSQDKIGTLIRRDLSDNQVELITGAHAGAFYTPENERNPDQKVLLAQSDMFLSELKAADALVIATPMYNFGIPAVLKAWIDLICRVGETFRYTKHGPEGLSGVEDLYLVVATGGAPVGSPMDFVVPYLKQVAAFIGIKNVHVVAADKMNVDADASLQQARAQIAAL